MAQRLTPLVSPTNFVSHHHLQAKDSRPRTTPRATGLFPRLSVMHYLSQSFSYECVPVPVVLGPMKRAHQISTYPSVIRGYMSSSECGISTPILTVRML